MFLRPGDTVAIISSARKISHQEIDCAIRFLSSKGLTVKVGKTIGSQCNQFAGDDCLRTEDLQWAISDKDIKAVFFARGGYGSVRIVDKVDFTPLVSNPKLFIGYSDVCVFLNHLYFHYNLPSVHGIMPVNINDETLNSEAVYSLENAIFGKGIKYGWKNGRGLADCSVKGTVIGGNLSILYSLLGSESFGSTDDKILFIEDLDEYLYHIDRMMQSLKRAGKLSKLKALLIGSMTQMHDNTVPFGKNALQIIEEAVKEYGYPVISDFKAGHIEGENHAIIIGKEASIDIRGENISLCQQ